VVGEDQRKQWRRQLAKVKWTKDDVIKRFQEAMAQAQPKAGQRPNTLQTLLSKIKGKPGEGEETV